jgi:hypothetical protein
MANVEQTQVVDSAERGSSTIFGISGGCVSGTGTGGTLPLNVVCFRYVSPGLADAVRDKVNKRIIAWLGANVAN